MLYFFLFVACINFVLSAQWEQLNFPNEKPVTSLVVRDDNLFAGTAGNGIFLSANNGLDWTPINNGLLSNYIKALLVSGTDIYAGTSSSGSNPPGIYKSTNDGALWVNVGHGIKLNSSIGSFASKSGNIYIGTYYSIPGGDEAGDIYVSSNSGLNWMNIFPAAIPISALMISGNYIFTAKFCCYKLYRSRLDLINWEIIYDYSPHLRIEAFGSIENSILANHAGNLAVSTDNGDNWTEITGPLVGYMTSFITVGKNIYAGKQAGGVVISTDKGITWSQFNDGMPASTIISFAVSGNYLYAGGYTSGIWRRSLLNLSPVEENPNVNPYIFSLSQNYPNPFNPATTISYSVPAGINKVSLNIYDMLGNEITVLVNEQKPAGEYQVEWNASAYSSGVYFYRLKTGEFTSTKKLLLMK